MRKKVRYLFIAILLFLSSCSAGIEAPGGASPDEGPDYDAKINTNSSSFTISSKNYKMQVSLPVVFPETRVKGKRFTVEVK
jgi:hypothetical protein